MNSYRIERADEGGRGVDGVPLVGDADATPWSAAERLEIDEHPWDEEVTETAAVGRIVYDDDALYLQFRVADDHIQAAERSINGEVYKDSCVELFASPWSDRDHYVNFEANCLGRFLLGYGPNREERRLIDPASAGDIRVETSVEGRSKEPSPADDGWWLAAALPFETLSDFVGRDVAPTAGTEWRANAYCCRGEPEPRFVAWSTIDTPDPDFHRPEYFGRLAFD